MPAMERSAWNEANRTLTCSGPALLGEALLIIGTPNAALMPCRCGMLMMAGIDMLKIFLEQASREQVWKELDARGMPVPALLMAIAGEDVAHNWEQKKGGRPSDPTFSKEQLEEKIRWEFKLVKSRDSFKALWEFLDQDGTGLLSHRQFLYQMKRPMRRATVDFSATINETVEHQSGGEAASSVSAPIGKLEIASMASGSPLPDAIGTYCTITFGNQHAKTNVAKQSSAATRWSFPGRSLSDMTRELATLEMSVESLQNMPKMQIKVFEDTTPQEQVHGLSDRTRSTEASGIGEVEICAEKLVDIMSNGNVSYLNHDARGPACLIV